MQQHIVYGATLFDDPHSTIDEIARDIILTHHESWNGSGYPAGLKGDAIPLAGRIVAIADVYDALCSRRVYKEPWNEENVLDELRQLAGIKFDPKLIDIFFEVFPNIKQTQILYREEENSE